MTEKSALPFAGRLALVVDDEPDLREILCAFLAQFGFSTLEAENGKLAFELAIRHPVDLVISDLRMPGGGGIELLERLRARDSVYPAIILVTGFGDVTAEQALSLGAQAMMTKPYHRAALSEHIHRAMGSLAKST